MLIGLPVLRDVLRRHTLASLAARLPMRVHLGPLKREEVNEYVRHRLKNAGRTNELFAEDALLLLAEATGGIMRRIDIVAHRALLEGLDKRSTLIDAAVMRAAIDGCADALA
jgi:type II secretory pathway predicted ATPase ExeA